MGARSAASSGAFSPSRRTELRPTAVKIRKLDIACKTLDPSRFPRSPWAEVAVSGRSNVGKSSLLNTLLGRKNIARISKDPGKTRSINFFAVNDRFYLVDLPGYGYAKVSAELRDKWLDVVEGYVLGRDALAGVVQLLDARHPPTKDDAATMDLLRGSGRPVLVALTKADKIPRSDRARALRDAGRIADALPVVFFSAKTGEGADEIWKWIEERV
ncbi:MAG: YihA family ribosome biogenesis GTP-binding protein [Candidatus Latescibacterota bacterium]|nr:MAG: YihA family ribosome biogenesis GTP-binding protein [Candidatus Latescibacterota bacterium]